MEWLNDTLESGTGSGGAAVEGNAATVRALDARTRSYNWMQITSYTFGISGTQQATSHYSVDDEYAYQLEKAMKILKIMQEQILFNSTSSTGGMGSVCATGARALRGLIAALTTNVQTGSGGSCALTEDLFNDLLQTIFENGNGYPDICFCNGYNRRRISSFQTSNTRNLSMDERGILRNTIMVYMSDFGDISIVLDRWLGGGNDKGVAPVIQMDKFKIAYLRKPFVNPLGVTGDSKEAQIIAEYTLEHLNEASSGLLSAMATS